MNWPEVEAKEIMVKRGGSVNPSKFPTEIFDLYSIPAFDRGEIDILAGADIGSSKNCIQVEDVLLSKIIPHIRRCWVVQEEEGRRQIGSGEWIIFRSKKYDPNFLRHYLTCDQFHHQFMNTVAGMGGSLVRARPAAVEKIKIPLPPLEEQKRIAAILDKADALRRKREKAIALTDDLLRSVFLDMFGDPVTNPKGWETSRLEDVCIKVTDGTHQSPKWAESGVPFLFIKHIIDNEITFDVDKYITEENWIELTRRAPIETGDVLYTTVGSYGNAALVGDNTRFCFQRHIAHIKPDKLHLIPEFLWVMMNSAGIKRQADTQVRGVAQKTLNLRELKDFIVFTPNIEAQKQFLAKISKIQRAIFEQKKHKAIFETLFQSLIQRAFKGELTSQKEAV